MPSSCQLLLNIRYKFAVRIIACLASANWMFYSVCGTLGTDSVPSVQGPLVKVFLSLRTIKFMYQVMIDIVSRLLSAITGINSEFKTLDKTPAHQLILHCSTISNIAQASAKAGFRNHPVRSVHLTFKTLASFVDAAYRNSLHCI